MSDNFDGVPALTGTIDVLTLQDPDGTPNRVLDADLPFSVVVSWTLDQAPTALLLDGEWTVKVHVESIGVGFEGQIGAVKVPATGVTTYNTPPIVVPAGTLPADVAPNSGLYMLRSVVTYRTASGKLTEIAGFGNGPEILVRKP